MLFAHEGIVATTDCFLSTGPDELDAVYLCLLPIQVQAFVANHAIGSGLLDA